MLSLGRASDQTTGAETKGLFGDCGQHAIRLKEVKNGEQRDVGETGGRPGSA